jgi:hypothetical protein
MLYVRLLRILLTKTLLLIKLGGKKMIEEMYHDLIAKVLNHDLIENS